MTAPARRSFASVLLLAACTAGPGGPPAQAANARANEALATLLAQNALAGARVGVLVSDLATGDVLCAHDADKGFLTASNMKLVSSAIALSTLGPDFQFVTRVVAAPSEGDTIDGDLFLVGGGDPSLGSEPGVERAGDAMAPLHELAAALHARGIRKVRGAVRGDASAQPFAPYGNGWQWDYLEEDYAAPCAALNFAQNVLTVLVHPTSFGQPARLELELPIAMPTWLRSEVATVSANGDSGVHFARAPHDPTVVVTGAIAEGEKPVRLQVAVPDPAAFAAAAFTAALRARGIEVGGDAAVGTAPPGAAILCEHRSPPLSAIAVPLLQHSINLYAEQCWRTAAQRAASAKSFADCERHGKEVLSDLGVDTTSMLLADGSGLSRRNLVQPRQLVALLAAVPTEPRLRPILAGLPVAGVSGTLKSRFRAGAATGRVRAKTGFVSYVVGLSGYLDRDGGREPLAFSILVNNFTCEPEAAKAAVDAFVEQLAAALR